MRHELSFVGNDCPDNFDDNDLDLPGGAHLVVSIGLERMDDRLTLHILTVANA